MKAHFAAAFLVLLSLGAAAQEPQAPQPKGAMPSLGRPTKATDEVPLLDFDGYFLGAWDFEWNVPDSPLSPAGPIEGTTAYRALGGSVYEAETTAEGPAGPFTVKERIEYRREQKALSKQVTDSRGYTYTSKATVAGDLGGIYYILYESEPFTAGGRTIRLKEAVRLLSPFNYRVSTTVSVDGGDFTNYGTPWWRKQGQ
jgi:hypothetical protein